MKGLVGWKKNLSKQADGYALAIFNKNLPLDGNPGLDDFYPIAIFAKSDKSIYGLLAPKGTPDKHVAVLENAIKNITHSNKFEKGFEKGSLKPYFVSSLDFKKAVQIFLNEQK